MTSALNSLPDEETLRAVEALALELAREGGRQATDGLAREITVDYKTDAKTDGDAPRDPVSEIDRAVEAMVRERVGERFPGHDIIGEEVELHPDTVEDFVWVVDPVDGTANFVNGYPLFCVSIGVLFNGVPVVGALWCSSTHALHPGVYHAHRGGGLYFEEQAFTPVPATDVRRRLSAAPGGSPGRTQHWDHRVTGSAAIELAFVAAGIFQSAWFGGLKIWDLAAGVLLIQEAGGRVIHRRGSTFEAFERFEAPAEVKEDRAPSLRDWRGLIIVGTDEAVAVVQERLSRRPSWFTRFRSKIGLGPRRRR
ncbi:MAG: inositol monophosphatase [Chloroflexi bacterium]|nr:inositol monophosphatase [Chloroflexota bacterium]MDA1146583.1 inositol monophosphatase [Chloroflexota bacterium]MQC82727.1 inositol monophosphatase [Chloroflexota bacterium]